MPLIAHIDMDAFFASVSQRDEPSLKGKPTVITANQYSSIIIAASYEAKALGLKVGTKISKQDNVAIRHCNHKHYQAISKTIMQCLYNITPDIEIYSIDEAFLDLSGIIQHYDSELAIIHHIKQTIFDKTSLPCSIGIAPNKALAKMASSENKPNGHCIITQDDIEPYLYQKPIQDLCGIGNKMQQFLNQHGVYTCDQMKNIPINFLSSRFGQIGRHLWYACQGISTSELSKPKPLKSLGHSKRLAKEPYLEPSIQSRLNQLTLKLCKRLREHNLKALTCQISVHTPQKHYKESFKLHRPTHSYHTLANLYTCMLSNLPWPLIISQIGIRVTQLTPHTQQDLLETELDLDLLMDTINKDGHTIQYGSFLLDS